jgi:diadenosine tetraphosphatase ApaH/serine/threonine PP2A family protein phosphatase
MHGFNGEPNTQDFHPNSEENKAVRKHMEEYSTNPVATDDCYRRDHEHWRAEHAEALAILRSAEAQILAHEAQILAHEAAAPHHHNLLRAIRALKPHLNGGPQA